MNLHLQPVRLATSSDDTEGQLVFVDGGLVAVLAHLSEQHDDDAGMWFLEAGFGRLDEPAPDLFVNLNEAQAWIMNQLEQA